MMVTKEYKHIKIRRKYIAPQNIIGQFKICIIQYRNDLKQIYNNKIEEIAFICTIIIQARHFHVTIANFGRTSRKPRLMTIHTKLKSSNQCCSNSLSCIDFHRFLYNVWLLLTFNYIYTTHRYPIIWREVSLILDCSTQ